MLHIYIYIYIYDISSLRVKHAFPFRHVQESRSLVNIRPDCRSASLPNAFDASLLSTARNRVPPFSLLSPTYQGSTGNLALSAVLFEDNTDQ